MPAPKRVGVRDRGFVGPTSTRLVVMEDGARASDLLDATRTGENTVIIKQGVSEAPAEFLVRVIQRTATLQRAATAIAQAVLVVAMRSDAQSVAGRRLIAQALLTELSVRGGGELLLLAEPASPSLRHELLAMVEAILGDAERNRASVRLRFLPVRRSSGTYPIPSVESAAAWETDSRSCPRHHGTARSSSAGERTLGFAARR